MHDVLLSLFSYVLIPVSTVLLLLLLFPLGDLLHRQLISACKSYSVNRFPYLQQLAVVAGLLWSYYAYALYTIDDAQIEETRPASELILVHGKVQRWHLERNFHLSMLLLINLMYALSRALNRTTFLRQKLLEKEKKK